MAWAGLILSALGTVASATAQRQQAQAQAKAANYNAAIEQMNAQQDKELIYKQSREKLAQIQASRAKSGVAGAGTPLLAMAESEANAEADVLARQQSADIQSNLYKRQAKDITRAGNIGAGASLLSGMSKLF